MSNRKPGRFSVLLMWGLVAVTAGIGLGFGWRGLWPQVLETPSVVFLPASEVKEKGYERHPYINYRVHNGDSPHSLKSPGTAGPMIHFSTRLRPLATR